MSTLNDACAAPSPGAAVWGPLAIADLLARLKLPEFAADSYAQAIAETPVGDGEDALERRMREISYLHLTRFVQYLLAAAPLFNGRALEDMLAKPIGNTSSLRDRAGLERARSIATWVKDYCVELEL